MKLTAHDEFDLSVVQDRKATTMQHFLGMPFTLEVDPGRPLHTVGSLALYLFACVYSTTGHPHL